MFGGHLKRFSLLKPDKKALLFLSLVTLVVFGGLGIGSIYFIQNISLLQLLHSGEPIASQLLWGGSYGVGSAFLALAIVQAPWFNFSKAFFTNVVKKLNPNYLEIAFYSLCAGIGEELLFRGGIQPLFNDPVMGIWVTSFIFIVLHGYLNPRDLQLSLYGIVMVGVSAGIGYLLVVWGIYASIMAHFIFDVIMFLYLKWVPEPEVDQE